jgi:hypothetical protein
VLAAGGFESNRDWLREAWGQNERGEWPADNFLIRGTRFNQGVLLLKHLLDDHGADRIGDPTQAHMVAIDARAPLYDGGICTRIDCVSLGVVVNRDAERFYDEGEDFWPKRYAIWGRLVAQQPGQTGYSIIDAKAIGRFMPPVFPGVKADSLPNWRASWAWTRPPSCAPRTPTTPPAASAPSTTPRWTTATPKADARQDALGAAHRHRAVLRLRAQARRHLHLPGPEDRRHRRRALWRPAQRQPVRGRRDDGRQRAGQGLHRRRRHVDRHGLRAALPARRRRRPLCARERPMQAA